MSYSSKVDADFVHYLESMVNLDELNKITEDLDEELKDSQQAMNDIKSIINALPKPGQDSKSGPTCSEYRHEDISNYLNVSAPKLLLPDMIETSDEVDLDDVLATLKSYIEDLRKNCVLTEPAKQVSNVKRKPENLNLEQYASSLDVLCKCLNNLKLKKNDDENNRNPDLESKLSVLCEDVTMITQIMQAKTAHIEADKNWTPTEQQSDALGYNQIISKLLSGINEVSYLHHSKN